MYDFISLFAPHLSRKVVMKAMELGTKEEIDAVIPASSLPSC
jgi:hypothetical protein